MPEASVTAHVSDLVMRQHAGHLANVRSGGDRVRSVSRAQGTRPWRGKLPEEPGDDLRDTVRNTVKVAALYDIHGNLPALEAVLADVPGEATILLGGDHVYGPYPAETLARLHALGERAVWLRGNCDRELSEPGSGPSSLDVLDWVRDRLSEEQIRFLRSLPATVTLTLDGLGETLFCHATPQNDVDFFTDITPEQWLAPLLADVAAATIVCGHSHLQFERIVDGKRLVNAGSVGMAYEDHPGAYWALLGPEVELRRSHFTPASLTETGYPQPWPTLTRAEATKLHETDPLRGG